MNILDFQTRKQKQEKISMITCYDYTFAKIIAKSNIDTILVGDSVSMTVHGHDSTLHATPEMMRLHTAAVSKGAPGKFLVADMPFLSFRKGTHFAADVAGELMKAGAHAVKLENCDGHLDVVEHLVKSGIPVMGHLGLTPQFVQTLGGHRVQGKIETEQARILNDALRLQAAGCFSLVLECIPSALAKKITMEISIPTIGIGAGVDCDGQVLVIQDMLGLSPDFKPKFLRTYFKGHEPILGSFNKFHEEVQNKNFPSLEESYSV